MIVEVKECVHKNPPDTHQIQELIQRINATVDEDNETFRNRWGWIATINDMSNNDITKWDYFFKMNVIEFLNTVSFFKDKGEYDIKMERLAHGQ